MLLSELLETCKEQHGQHIPDGIEITLTQFKTIVEKKVLTFVGKYRSVVRNMFINIVASPYIFNIESDGYVPDWVSDVGIAMSNQASSIASVIPLMYRQDHRTRLWYYEKPKLYTFMFGLLMIQGAYFPRLVAVDQDELESGLTEDWTIADLADGIATSLCIDLSAGYLLQSLGKSRRVVDFAGLPITVDTTDMIREGQALVNDTMQTLRTQSNWWLAI